MRHGSDYSASDDQLRSGIEDIADQLGVAVDGRFEFMVKARLADETLDKLAMLVNFVVEAARRALVDLENRNARLAELDHFKSALLANVSHELRSPLALILGPTEKWLASADLPDEQRRDLEVVLRNARALLKTVNDLLDVSKLEAGRLTPRFARVDLAGIVRGTCSLFEGAAREHHIDYVTSAPRELRGEVDFDMVQRVLLNLLSNAFKFGIGGGRISCVLESAGGAAELRVQDNGPGIPTAMRERIFERFTQVESEATRKAGGTGLGLAIAKEFVELHRGTIEATNAPGGGALFIVRLPLKAPEGSEVVDETGPEARANAPSTPYESAGIGLPAPALEPEAEVPGAADRGVVLIVEDNPEISQLVASALSAEYRIARAGNGREGLAQVRRQPPDLIVTDVMMPEMSGDELVHAIRSEPALDPIPIVVLTAKADDALRVELLESGAQDYMIKPFSRAELRARVRNLVTAKRAGDLLRAELEGKKGDLEDLAREVALRRHELVKSLDDVRRARDEVERLLHLRDEFISVAGHELRTPLTPLRLSTQRMMRATGSAPESLTTENVRAYVAMCDRQIEAMVQLADTLLDVSRIQLGSFSVDARPGVDLVEVAREVIARHKPQWEAARAPVSLQVEASPPPGRWDRVRLEQIVGNLLSNAIKYGGGHPIEIAVSRADHTARLEVTDHGTGISDADQARLFNRFERATPVTSVGGLGLGLYITRQIAAAHGGTVGVHSQPGAGATFVVELPLEAA
jgi:signal transduction histidine kinase